MTDLNLLPTQCWTIFFGTLTSANFDWLTGLKVCLTSKTTYLIFIYLGAEFYVGIVVAEVIMAPQLLTDTITISPTIILGMLVDINCPTKGTRLNIFIHYMKGIYKSTLSDRN